MADHSTPQKDDAHRAAPVRRPGGRTARVRQQILTAATDLMAVHGIDGFSYEEVAELAGVNKTTVYRNWPDRGELVVDVLSWFATDALAVPDSGDLRADLVEFLVALANSLSTARGRALSNVVASALANEEMRAILDTVHERRIAPLRRRLDKAVADGELPAVEVYFFTDLVSGPVHLFRWRRRGSFTSADAGQVVDVVLAGVRAIHHE